MATNTVYEDGDQLMVAVASGVASGDPVIFGGQPAVAQTDRGSDVAGKATLKFNGVHELTLPAGPHTAGDPVYHDGTDTLTVTATDTYFGVIVDDVASGATTARVRIGGTHRGIGS